MDDCQTSEGMTDNHFSIALPKVNNPNETLNENDASKKEFTLTAESSNDGLNDNFLVDLLSRDSIGDTENPEEKVLIPFKNKVTEDVEEYAEKGKTEVLCETIPSQFNNSLLSNLLTSDDKLKIVTEKDSSCTMLNAVIQISNGETFPSEYVHEVPNAVPENVKDEKKHEAHVKSVNSDLLEDSTFNNSKCVSSNSERKTGIQESVEKNMESCEMPNLGDSLRKPEDEIVEVSVQEAAESNIAREQCLEDILETNKNKYRCESDIWTDDDDDSSTTTTDSSSDSDFFQEMCEKSKPKKLPFVKTKGELGLDDLPPIEDLVISVNESEMTAIGTIYAVVEKLVVIHAMKGMKALDLDSVLFLSHDQPLGRVFDVFGPVNEPFYSVRFNNVEQINEKGVKVGAEVFFAPEISDITTYVFVEELQNQKGSDASWKHNNEPPEEFLDYSDDEKEKNAKRQRRFKNRNRQFADNPDAPSKRPFISGDSSNYIPPPKPVSQWNYSQSFSSRMPRPNPFQSHISLPSPSPSVHSLMSPVRVQNSFGSSPNQPQRFMQPQNILYRSSPQLFVSPYQQPHVFGQLTVLNHLSPALHVPPPPLPTPVMNNMPALVPASHFSAPQNYFNQTFSRSPSPVIHNQHMPRDPWLSNRPHTPLNIPPSHPLTVQIPNLGSPSVPVHQFSGEAGQQFVNIQNRNFNEPFVNNGNFPPLNVQPRFYHS